MGMFGIILLLVCVGAVDAIGWAQLTPHTNWAMRYGHQALVFNNEVWVLGGFTTPGVPMGDVWNSSDLGSWSWSLWRQANASAWPARYDFGAVVFKNKMWVMGGTGAGGEMNDIWYSSDGIIWTQEPLSDALWSPRAGLSVVVFNNKMWVLGGDSDGAPTNDVWCSDDGLTWTQVQGISWNARRYQQAVVFDNRIWVLGGDLGYSTPTPATDVWYSYDGSSWTEANATAWPARYSFGAVVFNNTMWVMEGLSGSGYLNDNWYSTNGTFWTQSYPGWAARRDFASVVAPSNAGVTQILVLGGYNPNSPWYMNDVIESASASSPPVTLYILPQSPVVMNGTTTNYAVILSAAPQGISGIKYTFCLNNSIDGQITSFTDPPWAVLVSGSGGPSINSLTAADLTGSSGKYNISLGTFSVLNMHPGTTIINLGSGCDIFPFGGTPTIYPFEIDDRLGGYYNPTIVPGRFTVTTDRIPFPRPQPLGGYFPPPTDPNHDGLYEDLDGNGNVNMNDVVVMFTNLDDIAHGRYGLINYYDFDHSGDIGFNDVVRLYTTQVS